MRLYLCTLYERPTYGEPRPVVFDGVKVCREIVADNGGKARYRWWRSLRESWEEIRLQDIRVLSLRNRKVHISNGWQNRLETANAIVRVIAAHGRHFLSENSDRRELVENPFVSHFVVDKNHEVWFVDRYTRKHILVRHQDWDGMGWSDGGTLRSIVQHLAAHISEGAAINPGYFGISPDWMPNHWGYGDDMRKVSDEINELLNRKAEAA